MEKVKSSSRRSLTPAAGATWILALLLVVCLAECATGSCLSYGHSCWGAHGKRSGTLPATAPDWYFTRLLRRFAANGDIMNRVHHAIPKKNEDINAIFQNDVETDTPSANYPMSGSRDAPELMRTRNSEGIPMLDDDLLSKVKIWQVMKEMNAGK